MLKYFLLTWFSPEDKMIGGYNIVSEKSESEIFEMQKDAYGSDATLEICEISQEEAYNDYLYEFWYDDKEVSIVL
jgi:hypothetical protein